MGGNQAARPDGSWSARDGYGALVTVELDDARLVREHRAGEGFAAQNSATLLIGIGDHRRARSVTVRWPSGVEQRVEDVAEGTMLTVHEDAADRPAGAFVRERYRIPGIAVPPPPREPPGLGPPLEITVRTASSTVNLYTTMATWCAPCREEIPHLRGLRERFSPEDLSLRAIPVDPEDTPEKLQGWAASLDPPYDLLTDAAASEIAEVNERLLEVLRVEGVPATILADRAGRVLRVHWGPPTTSEIRSYLDGRFPPD